MKKWGIKFVLFFVIFIVFVVTVNAQCSICTKTAQQLGEGVGKGLNAGIIYLMLTPLSVAGFIGYRWWRREKKVIAAERE